MQDKRVVLLVGTSLFVTGVEASLRMRSDLIVVQIDDGFSSTQSYIIDVRPDVIVIDSGDVNLATSRSLLQLLKRLPNIPVIGIDPAIKTEVTVFSAHNRRVVKSEDLVLAIQTLTNDAQD